MLRYTPYYIEIWILGFMYCTVTKEYDSVGNSKHGHRYKSLARDIPKYRIAQHSTVRYCRLVIHQALLDENALGACISKRRNPHTFTFALRCLTHSEQIVMQNRKQQDGRSSKTSFQSCIQHNRPCVGECKYATKHGTPSQM